MRPLYYEILLRIPALLCKYTTTYSIIHIFLALSTSHNFIDQTSTIAINPAKTHSEDKMKQMSFFRGTFLRNPRFPHSHPHIHSCHFFFFYAVIFFFFGVISFIFSVFEQLFGLHNLLTFLQSCTFKHFITRNSKIHPHAVQWYPH